MAKVAISYGHGENTYRDKKSKGVTVNGVAYAEHTHNAEVGIRVTKILRDHGVQVLEVQPAFGKDVALSTRIANANNWKADLYYSIHSNAGHVDARGWCGFFWAGSADGERIANLYLQNMNAIGLPLYHSGKWGSIRGTWNAFQELQDTNMPALLTENGFMTNKLDFEYIFKNKDDYYNRSSVAHAKTILSYFKITYKRPVPTPEVKPVAKKEEEPKMKIAIVANSLADLGPAEVLRDKLKAPIVLGRDFIKGQKIASEVYIVGGANEPTLGDKVTHFGGANRFDVAQNVRKFVGM